MPAPVVDVAEGLAEGIRGNQQLLQRRMRVHLCLLDGEEACLAYLICLTHLIALEEVVAAVALLR